MSEILLSFCIPVMNRLDDLKATLRRNLLDNILQRDRLEFIVISFDKERKTSDWIQQNFREELASGYLRFFQSDQLNSWHFGRAKNAFRGKARGRIYSSLDGDNFTGPGGGQHIIDVFEANDYDCIFHQFQGDWGDGTCGRVSMVMQDYEEIGYDESFLPRQWDELDAILSILVQRPSRRYICYRGKSIVEKSGPFARFLHENAIRMDTVEIDGELDPFFLETRQVAVGQQKSSYVQDDKKLKYSSIFNHLSSFFKNTKSDVLRNQYVLELVNVQRTMAEHLDCALLLQWFLVPQRTDGPILSEKDILLVACIKNEPHLENWLEHYRGLGVTHFFLIDDDSVEPISRRVDSGDVWVWKPICGKFRYSKAFWLELLLRQYAEGCWVITVDSDEYVELPVTNDVRVANEDCKPSRLKQLIKIAGDHGTTYFAGFLLDMVPGVKSLSRLDEDNILEGKDYNRFQFRPTGANPVYRNHNTVKWSYGELADWAYRIDIRFRLNRAIDSLRKFPLFLMGPDIHLNQGFHDLIISGEKRTARELSRTDLLVIRHLNVLNAQYNSCSATSRPANAYHHETKINIERLQKHLVKALRHAAICPFTYRFIAPELVPLPGQETITIRLAKSKDNQNSFATIPNRTNDVPLFITDTPPRYRNGAIEAKSMREAVHWLARVTPFTVIHSWGASLGTLSIAGGKEGSTPSISKGDIPSTIDNQVSGGPA